MVTVQLPKQKRVSRKEPLKHVELDLRERIANGQWALGAIIPSRRELASEFDVDLNTIQRALAPLLADGTLRAENGRGTFVATDQPIVSASTASATARDARCGRIGVTAFFNEELSVRGEELPATMDLLKAMEKTAIAQGGKTVFMNRWQQSGPELGPEYCVRELLKQGVDAVAVVDVYTHPYVLSELRGMPDLAELPVVYVSNMDHYVPCAHVYFDNRDAGFKAAAALIFSGYDEIVFCAPYQGRWVDSRSEGTRIACDCGAEPVKFRSWPSSGHFDVNVPDLVDRLAIVVKNMFDTGNVRGGIVAAHDRLALAIIEEADRRGIVPGRDFGIIGFDDEPRAFTRGLTTIRPPLEAMAIEAIRVTGMCLAEGRWNRVSSLRADIAARATHAKG